MTYIVKPSARVHHLKIILGVLLMTFVLYAMGTILRMDFFLWIIIVWVIGLILAIFATIIIKFKSIELGDDEVIMKVGVLNTRKVAIPYTQITNVNVQRSLFDRIMGLGKIEIDTPGTNLAEISMEYIPKQGLEDIEKILNEKKVRVN